MKLKFSKKFILLFSLVLIAALASVFLLLRPTKNNNETELLLEGSSFKSNTDIEIPIRISTANFTVNAVEAYLKFDPEYLEIKSIEKDGSILQIWLENQINFSNTEGTISLAGGLPTPGFRGSGVIVKIKAKTLKSGNTQINFTDKSRILLDDGNGTVAPLQLSPTKITIER